MKRVHYIDNYLLNPQHPVTVNLIGAGGTGSQVLTCLARLDVTLRALGHPGLFVTLYDPDIVTDANIGRQLFGCSDLGLNKAQCLITRVNNFFGNDWKAVPDIFPTVLKDARRDDMANITVTCTDNIKSRLDLWNVLKAVPTSNYRDYETPLYCQAEMELAQAFYATNAARAAFYPNITLSGTLGWTNNGGGVIVNPGQWLLNAIGSLTQPLFNRGTNIANLKIAKSRQEEAKLLFRQSLLNAGKEVNDALTAWQTAKSQIEINARQVETLCDAVRKTESLMRHSNATYLEVLTAQQSLLEAEVQQLQTRFERIQSVIKLYHVLGGGM